MDKLPLQQALESGFSYHSCRRIADECWSLLELNHVDSGVFLYALLQCCNILAECLDGPISVERRAAIEAQVWRSIVAAVEALDSEGLSFKTAVFNDLVLACENARRSHG